MASPGDGDLLPQGNNEDYLGGENSQNNRKDDDTVKSKAAEFETTVLEVLYDLKKGLAGVENRVASLEDQQSLAPRGAAALPGGRESSTGRLTPQGQSSTTRRVPNSTPQLQSSLSPGEEWGDNVDVSMDYTVEDWESDSGDTPSSTKLFKVEERTEKLLANHFSAAVSNPTRRQWKEKYGAPNLTATACPNLDKVIKSRLTTLTKSRDKQLAKQQALLLDAVGPITHILEGAAKGELTQKTALDAAQTALKLLGNASAHMSRERRKNAIQSMNSRLVDMAEDDSLYKEAAPCLFGDGFCKKAKERDDELKCLSQTTKPTSHTRANTLFRGGRSSSSNSYQTRGGSGQDYYRGRGRGSQRGQRYQPYQSYQRYQKPKKDDKKN